MKTFSIYQKNGRGSRLGANENGLQRVLRSLGAPDHFVYERLPDWMDTAEEQDRIEFHDRDDTLFVVRCLVS